MMQSVEVTARMLKKVVLIEHRIESDSWQQLTAAASERNEEFADKICCIPRGHFQGKGCHTPEIASIHHFQLRPSNKVSQLIVELSVETHLLPLMQIFE